MWYQICQYFKFICKSTNQHGVHSPFVYNLVTKCFYDKTNYEVYKTILEYRKELLKSKSSINVTDLGKGSLKLKSNTRTVSKMAKLAGSSYFRTKLMYRIVNYFQCKNILELGTSLGIATQAMHLGNPKAHITTIEGCSNLMEFAKNRISKKKQTGITFINEEFQKAINNLKDHSFDLVFFDGNHQKDKTLQYFETLLPLIHNDTLFIFDDIYWSKEMTEAWEQIKQHPKVTVTIDTFYWGLVFFRKEQNKEHFTIRV